VHFQTIVGFGGAFTDAAAVNFAGLSSKLRDAVAEGYFGADGLEYSLGRIPMAACDFSTHEYSYDDTSDDFSLSNFSIAMDKEVKLPLIQRALSMQNVTLFASPWSPPAWMKTNDNRIGGMLLGQAGDKYHKTWAQYFVKFLSAYKDEGVNIWGITVQNEPSMHPKWDSNEFSAASERDFIKLDLGPALKSAHPDVKLMMLDDQFLEMPGWVETVMADPEAAKYVDGVGFHWYENVDGTLHLNNHVGEAAKEFPSLFFLATEACTGEMPWSRGPKIGEFSRAMMYARDIVSDMNNMAVGWTDWNLLLDHQGGPNHAKNWVDAPMIVSEDKKTVYKQPMYYAMGHFAKFVRPGATRVQLEVWILGFQILNGAGLERAGVRGSCLH